MRDVRDAALTDDELELDAETDAETDAELAAEMDADAEAMYSRPEDG